MSLATLRIRESRDHQESLACCLEAILRWSGLEVPGDDLTAALGVSLVTASSGRDDDDLGCWPAYGRDLSLVEAAALFGMRLRDAHPPEAARGLANLPEFAQHFEASYKPLVLGALANNEPVIAWQGWPDDRRLAWGVITGTCEQGIGLAGTTIGAGGEAVPLDAPPVQLYVVESVAPRQPQAAALVRAAMSAACHLADESHGRRWGIRAGPAALELWAQRLASDQGISRGGVTPSGHLRLANHLIRARESATRFLDRHAGAAPAGAGPMLADLHSAVRRMIAALLPAADTTAVEQACATLDGRRTLAGQVRAAAAIERQTVESTGRLHQHLSQQAPPSGDAKLPGRP